MRSYPTSYQNIAIGLVLEWLEESRVNRTPEEYEAIARKVPPLAACQNYINSRLPAIANTDKFRSHAICDFKAGDKRIVYRPFPTSISTEVVRVAFIQFFGRSDFWKWRLTL